MYDNVQEPIKCHWEYCELKSSKLLCYVNGKFIVIVWSPKVEPNMCTTIPWQQGHTMHNNQGNKCLMKKIFALWKNSCTFKILIGLHLPTLGS